MKTFAISTELGGLTDRAGQSNASSRVETFNLGLLSSHGRRSPEHSLSCDPGVADACVITLWPAKDPGSPAESLCTECEISVLTW